jgi:hypothetical protein
MSYIRGSFLKLFAMKLKTDWTTAGEAAVVSIIMDNVHRRLYREIDIVRACYSDFEVQVLTERYNSRYYLAR